MENQNHSNSSQFNMHHFQEAYKYSEEKLSEIGLSSTDLQEIFDDFISIKPSLESAIMPLASTLQKIDKVHSIRTRIKDPYHLLDKICRKNTPERSINISNYKEEIKDLMGLRAIHLYKGDCFTIHQSIIEKFQLAHNEPPTIKYRQGDDIQLYREFPPEVVREAHQAGYRSIHYIVKTTPLKENFYAEIQVRTLFEEGWSEIDHTIRYPNNTGQVYVNNLLLLFNRLAGACDEFAGYINYINHIMAQSQYQQEQLKAAQENQMREVEELSNQIQDLMKENKNFKDENQTLKRAEEYLRSEMNKLQKQSPTYGQLPSLININKNLGGSYYPESPNLSHIVIEQVPIASLLSSSNIDRTSFINLPRRIICKNPSCGKSFEAGSLSQLQFCPHCNTVN